MQTCVTIASAWARLKNREIDCETALKLLVNEQGVVNFDLLDKDVSSRFFSPISMTEVLRVLPHSALYRKV